MNELLLVSCFFFIICKLFVTVPKSIQYSVIA